jgi:hypothetical protein
VYLNNQVEDGPFHTDPLVVSRGRCIWAVVPLRMTSSGFQLLDALLNKDILNTLKTEFKDDSLRTIRTIAKQLLENYLKKKTEGLLDDLP